MAVAKWKQFTKEQLQEMANQCESNAGWIKQMGYKIGGSYPKIVKQILEAYPDIDISHFKGQGWMRNTNSYELLSHDYQGKRNTIKRALEAVRGHRCEKCGLTEWNGQSIPLEVHHINGNNQDNDPNNLQLLCPNCHAQTGNYRGKNIINYHHQQVDEQSFVEALRNNVSIRQALLQLNLAPKGANYDRTYKICEKYPDLIDKFLKK